MIYITRRQKAILEICGAIGTLRGAIDVLDKLQEDLCRSWGEGQYAKPKPASGNVIPFPQVRP